jgi:hypothetical protein
MHATGSLVLNNEQMFLYTFGLREGLNDRLRPTHVGRYKPLRHNDFHR